MIQNKKKLKNISMRKKSALRIAVIFNLKRTPKKGMPHDFYAEYDDISVPNAIAQAIRRNGDFADLIEQNKDMFQKLISKKYDFVFNIAEGMNGNARESQVPAILDMLEIPYTSSGVITQALTLDKRRKKEVLYYHGINTPKFILVDNVNEKLDKRMKYPMIVKPNFEGSSKGITNNSIVNNEKELRKIVKFVIEEYKQPALIEEYLPGREFTVSVLGNKNPKVLPIVEITFDHLPKGVKHIDSYEVKWIYDNPKSKIDPIVCPAKISEFLKKKIEDVVLRSYKVLEIVDFCRMDVRLDAKGNPHIIDINAIPGLMPDPKENSRFPKSCYALGMTYDEIIITILNEAIERYESKGIKIRK